MSPVATDLGADLADLAAEAAALILPLWNTGGPRR
jgi:hypothetical protein